MTSAKASIEKSLNVLNVRRETRKIILKEEQDTGVSNLLLGSDVLAILPTGFGKNMIYTIFPLASQEIRLAETCVLVISPLKSLMQALSKTK